MWETSKGDQQCWAVVSSVWGSRGPAKSTRASTALGDGGGSMVFIIATAGRYWVSGVGWDHAQSFWRI